MNEFLQKFPPWLHWDLCFTQTWLISASWSSAFQTIHILSIPQNPAKFYPINEVFSDFPFIYNSLQLS